MSPKGGDRTVYSSEHGRVCPHCGLPTHKCQCRANPRGAGRAAGTAVAGDGVARVRREKKGRGGKTVTTVTGLPLAPDALRELAKELRRHCGTGGTVKDGVVEIQGDHADKVVAALEARAIPVKRAGG
jgi:translation initiation factor 1